MSNSGVNVTPSNLVKTDVGQNVEEWAKGQKSIGNFLKDLGIDFVTTMIGIVVLFVIVLAVSLGWHAGKRATLQDILNRPEVVIGEVVQKVEGDSSASKTERMKARKLKSKFLTERMRGHLLYQGASHGSVLDTPGVRPTNQYIVRERMRTGRDLSNRDIERAKVKKSKFLSRRRGPAFFESQKSMSDSDAELAKVQADLSAVRAKHNDYDTVAAPAERMSGRVNPYDPEGVYRESRLLDAAKGL